MNTSRLHHLPPGRHWLGALILALLFAPLTAAAQTEPTEEVRNVEAPADEGPDPFEKPEQRERVSPLRWVEDDSSSAVTDPGGKAADALEPGIAAGGAADADAAAQAKADFPEAWAELEAMDRMIERGEIDLDARLDSELDTRQAVPKGTPGVFTRYSGNINTQMWQFSPWNKIGKLYFTTPGGGSSYCTANVISQRNILVTAAHCLYTRGQGWHSNFRFVPADRFGVAPYGVYGWQSAGIMTNWITIGGRRWDVGMIRLGNNLSTGIPVASYVGWLGRTWNQPYVMNLHSVGYASNLSTQYTHICAAESFNGGLDVLAKGCDMTYGSSGGGWLLRYHPYSSSGAHNLVTGVTSGPYPGWFGTTFVGPRFSSANFVPLCSFYGC
jgi:V8-like Glu-specific endopeptidase